MPELKINPTVFRYALLVLATLCLFYAYTYRNYYYKLQNNNYYQNDFMSMLGGSKLASINARDARFSYPARDYYVLSSFNSCCAGLFSKDYVDTQPLINCISRGVRLLDFEIFQKDGETVVAAGLGRDKNGQCLVKGTFNHLPLDTVLETVKKHAFGATAPNPDDPLFLHFRFCTDQQLPYYRTGEYIRKHFANRLLNPKMSHNGKYWDEKNNMVKMKLLDLKNKVIIICNDDNNRYKDSELITYINLSNSLKEFDYVKNEAILSNSGSETKQERKEANKKRFSMSIPNITTAITNSRFSTHKKHGINFICMYFGSGPDDDDLRDTIKTFEDYGSAFILKDEPLRFVESTIPKPKPQTKKVSMETKQINLPMYSGKI